MKATQWLQRLRAFARRGMDKNASYRARLSRWLILGGIPYYVLSVLFGEPRHLKYLSQVFDTVFWAMCVAGIEHAIIRLRSERQRAHGADHDLPR